MKKTLILTALSLLVGCGSEESTNLKGSSTITQLSGGVSSSKSWKIETAALRNINSSDLIITDLANVKDDELVFQGSSASEATLVWNVRNDIRMNASTKEMALLDYYLSPSSYQLALQSNGKLSTGDSNIQIEVISENKAALVYKKGTATLQLNLAPSSVQKSQEITSLNFEKISSIEGQGLDQAAGLTGSLASNSLYIAYKPTSSYELLVKYDISNNTYKSQRFDQSDYVTKEIHIINDQVKVIGGQYVNTYALNLDKDVTTASHGLTLTRFGSSTVDNKTYLFGGNFQIVDGKLQAANANKIYSHDQMTNQLVPVGSLPENRFWAHGEIVDGNLYVFGGSQEFFGDVAEDEIFAVNIASGQTQTHKLPFPLHRTFTSRYGKYILVGGQVQVINPFNNTFELKTTFGLFNTQDKKYTELPANISGVGVNSVYGLTIVGKNVYILYGSYLKQVLPNYVFSILKAPLE